MTTGEDEVERLVATPVQVLRAAMRLYTNLGLGGFTLGILDGYTGARWSELVGQQRHEYESEERALLIRQPLKEVGGRVLKAGRLAESALAVQPLAARRRSTKKGRTKTPAGTRPVQLPPSIAVFYEELMDSHQHPFVLCTPEGKPWRRSNFRQRYWRPAWDGRQMDDPYADDYVPPILPWFTFHEGRHTHATWLAEDGIPEVARRARLGQKMKGMARIYDHVTPTMRQQVLNALEVRWLNSLAALTSAERAQLVAWFPHLKYTMDAIQSGGPKVLETAGF